MKRVSPFCREKAFTLLELLVVSAIVVLLVVLIIPVNSQRKGPQTVCMSNLKQCAVGSWMWASDHGNQFPWEVSTNAGGTREWIESSSPVDQLRVVAVYLVQPAPLKCPSDTRKTPAKTFDGLSLSNLSYFVNADASTSNQPAKMILSGDRHLQEDGKPVTPGLFLAAENRELSWTLELHPTGGNLAFADGHVEFVKTQRLQAVIQQLPQVTNRFLIP